MALAILSGAGLALGLMAIWDRQSAPAIIIRDPLPDATIVVSVEGAVATPGIYTLRGDARVADAVDQSGGALPGADFREINLAARLSDGERIFVSTLPGLNSTVGSSPVPPIGSGNSAGDPDGNLIDLNTATLEALDALPGIGPVLAQRIIDDRNERGPYPTVADLARVSGISTEMVEEISALVTV
ncbi:MAG: ComEA family DNA-binding protein, partial [Chloroflexota bacterium]|nr:ComEA family DNA-binding protein [Chloroflexota bacterium]